MKVLYIGHYKENSGWSNAAINFILALDSIGVDVVCRNIKLTNIDPEIPHRIKELEQKSLSGITHCIQHVLPHHLVGTTKFKKNVAYFVNESYPIKNTSWYENLKQMDEVWVTNRMSQIDLSDAYCPIKTRIIPHTFDLSLYTKTYPKINFNIYNNRFKFYTIADINDRKNLSAIIKCFYSEFSNDEPVALVLKLKKYGWNQNQLAAHIKNWSNEIKQKLRIYKDIDSYTPEIIITSDMTNEQIYSLHQSCDCFLCPSHGEGWSIPSFEAMCFGKTPICSDEGGTSTFIPDDLNCGVLVEGVYGVCDHSDSAFPEIFNGKQEWFMPSECSIKNNMRYYFENKDNIDRSAGLKHAQEYSFENVANMIKDALND